MKAKIITKNGNPYFSIDGSDYVPAGFRSFRPTPANVSLFHRSDVKLYQFIISEQITGMDIPYSLYPPVWVDEREYDFEALDVQIDMFRRFAPDGKLWVFIQLDTPRQWIARDPDISDSFNHLEVALFDERWKRAAADYAKALINYCEEKYDDLVFAYAFTAGRSCEWFQNIKTVIETPVKLTAWRKYLKDDSAQLPAVADLRNYGSANIEPTDTTDGILRSENSIISRYHRFMRKNSGEVVCYFAGEIQKALAHKKPIGTFYGYSDIVTTEGAPDTMAVFNCSDIDIIFSPVPYDKYRKLEGVCGFQLPKDSLALHGKIYLAEMDHRTPLAKFPLEAPVIKNRMGYRLNKYRLMDDCYDTEEETVQVLRRELATTLAEGASMWWFDFFGGYYATPTLEGEIKREVAVLKRFADSRFERRSVAQIAVFHDGASIYTVLENCGVSKKFIFESMYEIAKLGAPFDFYHIDDLKNVDLSRYKLCIFPDAMAISDENAAYIKEKLSDTYKLWVYAPGYVGDCFSQKRMNALIGMETERITANEVMPVSVAGHEYSFGVPVSPMFRVTDDEAEVIGTYTDGTAAAAIKGKNVYFSAATVPADALRSIACRAGVHMYTEKAGGALSVSSQMISYQTTDAEDITLTLPEDGVYEELFCGGVYKTSHKKLIYHAERGETRLFMRMD